MKKKEKNLALRICKDALSEDNKDKIIEDKNIKICNNEFQDIKAVMDKP